MESKSEGEVSKKEELVAETGSRGKLLLSIRVHGNLHCMSRVKYMG